MSWLEGKRVLVTGGAGAFGQKFLAHARQAGAAEVIVFSRDEMKHAALRRVAAAGADGFLRIVNGDITHPESLRQAMRAADCVVHAAAMKHLPECELNPAASTRVNVTGTQNVVDAFLDAPSSTYGAQKYLAEKLVGAADRPPEKRAFSLRYSNVMDSTGAVFHIFLGLLGADRTATVNGRQTSRGFVSQAQVIATLDAALAASRGGEVHVLVPQVIRIAELAEAMRELIGRGKVNVVEQPGYAGEKESATLVMGEERSRAVSLAGLPSREVITLDLAGRHSGATAADLPHHGLTLEDCQVLSGAALGNFVRPLLENPK
jgi:UDP-N-acetylglucosamine 4,6-dehydratase